MHPPLVKPDWQVPRLRLDERGEHDELWGCGSSWCKKPPGYHQSVQGCIVVLCMCSIWSTPESHSILWIPCKWCVCMSRKWTWVRGISGSWLVLRVENVRELAFSSTHSCLCTFNQKQEWNGDNRKEVYWSVWRIGGPWRRLCEVVGWVNWLVRGGSAGLLV